MTMERQPEASMLGREAVKRRVQGSFYFVWLLKTVLLPTTILYLLNRYGYLDGVKQSLGCGDEQTGTGAQQLGGSSASGFVSTGEAYMDGVSSSGVSPSVGQDAAMLRSENEELKRRLAALEAHVGQASGFVAAPPPMEQSAQV